MVHTTNDPNNRRRSLSGASALLIRRFARQSNSSKSTSDMLTKRTALVSSPADDPSIKLHIRIVPHIDNPSRSLIFDIVDRELKVGQTLKVGRFFGKNEDENYLSFRSKVVSRCHSEIYVATDGKLFIRDTKSSSGTFLNHVRLSPANKESRPVEIHDNDIVQLGVDFQNGIEESFRSVKMKFEVNRSSRPLSFNLNAFQNIRNLTQYSTNHTTTTAITTSDHNHHLHHDTIPLNHLATSPSIPDPMNYPGSSTAENTTHCQPRSDDMDECCICLYALAPSQALFVSPCSHTYHFKCIRPLLESYPGFQCPICRSYSDLEANVAIEVDALPDPLQSKISEESAISYDPPHEENHAYSNTPSSLGTDNEDELAELDNQENMFSNSFIPLPTTYSDILLNTDNEYITYHSIPLPESTPQEDNVGHSRRSHLMGKLKMVFFEKRKSGFQQGRGRKSRPSSYPDIQLIP
ncbi:hypothetical protein BDB01DRAFT_796417 [Pilobolus umbonatus]|nr:hypothetical protein BDB01DRAFT_796417 [Pilobolus umbonatus]